MFQLFMISITLVPLLLGVGAAQRRDGARARSVLRVGWVLYAALWFSMLYYLRYRWA